MKACSWRKGKIASALGSSFFFSSSREFIFGGEKKKVATGIQLWTKEDVPMAGVASGEPCALDATLVVDTDDVHDVGSGGARGAEPVGTSPEGSGDADSPDRSARKFAVEHGIPPYIVPPDRIIAWSHTHTSRGIEVQIQLDQVCTRTVEIWTVTWDTNMKGVINKNGEFGDIKGVHAAAAFLKGVRVRASKFACNALDGSGFMTITAKPPFGPSFPVSVSSVYVLTRVGAGLRWLPSKGDTRRSEDERIRRLSSVFQACQSLAMAA